MIRIIFLLLLFTQTSCEGYRCAKGIILDKTTSLPLDSVLVKVKSGKQKMFSDTSGNFRVCNQFGGCVFGCEDIIVEFSKKGYKTILLKNEECIGTLYLEK
jgi:hypothetical protein